MRSIPLSLHGQSVRTVFDLRGHNETSTTAALGYVLSRCAGLTQQVLDCVVHNKLVTASNIKLEVREDGRGRTDLEVVGPDLHVIIEAKVGWHVPTQRQLENYARRLERKRTKHRCVVALSNTAQAAARDVLPKRLRGVSVRHLGWREITSLADASARKARGVERHLLREFVTYLEQTVMSSSKPSDFAYVVSLGSGVSQDWGLAWIAAVTEERMYFHPVGHGYPHEPPAYMGFRYRGRLQAIHRVLESRVVTRPSDAVRGASKKRTVPHFVHRLGPPFMVDREIRSGPIRNRRAWCRLDELLTSKTVEEAARRSRKHLNDLEG